MHQRHRRLRHAIYRKHPDSRMLTTMPSGAVRVLKMDATLLRQSMTHPAAEISRRHERHIHRHEKIPVVSRVSQCSFHATHRSTPRMQILYQRRVCIQSRILAKDVYVYAHTPKFHHGMKHKRLAGKLHQSFVPAHPRTLPASQNIAADVRRSKANHLSPHSLQKPHNRLDPSMKVRQMELLIRCMEIVIRQSKPHHHGRDLQLTHKIPHNRD